MSSVAVDNVMLDVEVGGYEGQLINDPLDLDEIKFSCDFETTEKDTDEFDYDDDLFKPQHNVGKQDTSGTHIDGDNYGFDNILSQTVISNFPISTRTVIHPEEDVDVKVKIDVTENPIGDFTEDLNQVQKPDNISTEVNNTSLTTLVDDCQANCAGDVAGNLTAAQSEWDKVQCIQARQSTDSNQENNVVVKTTPFITFPVAKEYYEHVDLSKYKPLVKTSIKRSGFSAFIHKLFGPPSLNRDLEKQREMVFCLAACQFENEVEMNIQILQTIYKTITGSKFDCPRYGSHYEEIGFQGNDPATDLRGSGLLGLMQILHLVTNESFSAVYRNIFKLSTDETQNFPFCLMAINITRITLEALREGCLNKECNRQQEVFSVVNDFFVAAYFHLYEIWKTQHKTVEHSGFVIKDVEHFAKKNPRNLIKKLESHLMNNSQKSNRAAGESYVTIDKL